MRNLLLSIIALSFVVGCSSSRKKTEDSTVSSATSQEAVKGENLDNAPMSFDSQGSDSGKIEGLFTVQFDYDKAAIKASEKKKLEQNAAWIKSRPKVKVQVEGHCDQRGSIEYNLSLGERRANAVKSALVGMGVPANRLSTISYGKERLVETGESDSAMAKNRRANFVPAQQ